MNKILCLQLVASKNNKPTLLITKDINNELMYETMPLSTGFNIHCANEFLRSLNTGIEIKFENYRQYSALINKISRS